MNALSSTSFWSSEHLAQKSGAEDIRKTLDSNQCFNYIIEITSGGRRGEHDYPEYKARWWLVLYFYLGIPRSTS